MRNKNTNNKGGQRSRGPKRDRKRPAHSKSAHNHKIYNKSNPEGIRLNKYIANSGICSRREADTFIEAGLVHVNDKPVTQMGFRISKTDEIKFDRAVITPKTPIYNKLNKPQ